MTPEEYSGKRGQDLGKIAREYEFITCMLLPSGIFGDIKYYYDRGLEADLIIEAVKITKKKGAGWKYTKAILERCLAEGILTWARWDHEIRWKKAIAKLKKRWPFSFDEEKDFAFILIEAYRDELEAFPAKYEKWLEEHKNDQWDEEYIIKNFMEPD